jgi:hypothetical protein
MRYAGRASATLASSGRSEESHDGEPPTRFECFWIALRAAHVLQSGQGALIGRLYE